jgi:hypothetical protein
MPRAAEGDGSVFLERICREMVAVYSPFVLIVRFFGVFIKRKYTSMKYQASIFFALVLVACGETSSFPEPGATSGVASSVAALVASGVAPPPACGTNTIASGANGAAVIVASDNWNGSNWILEVCGTTDGVHWVGPTQVGDGQYPVAAIGPNGRAVLVWSNQVGTGPVGVMGSILAPGGTWSGAVIISTNYGHAHLQMDSSGNALAMWSLPPLDSAGPVQTSTLAASSTSWTSPVTLASFGGLGALVGNAAGDVLVTWRTRTTNLIQGAAGTILGGFRPTVTFAPTLGYFLHPAVPAMNAAGQAVVAWESVPKGTEYATMTASGTWSAPTQLAFPETPITNVVNSAGNFVLTWTAHDGGVETLTVTVP